MILLAPSRCGKTPTSMYLALQHGLFVANYPLVDEDLERDAPARDRSASYRERCFGLITTVDRLSRVRSERRPDSHYASLGAVPVGAAPGRAAVTPPTGCPSSTPRPGRWRRSRR